MKITGDPFVDAGALAMSMAPGKTTMDKINFALDVYVDNWGSKIHSMFLNSTITSPAKSKETEQKKTPKERKEDTIKFFSNIHSDSKHNEYCKGCCSTCGMQKKLFPATRCELPLSGSGAFVNFHHGHCPGILLCTDCITKLFFLPLAVLNLGGKYAILQVQDINIKTFWIDYVIQKNFDKISKGTSNKMLSTNLKNPQNALFEFAAKIISNISNGTDDISIQLFHFTNYGSGPKADIHTLPNPVFGFLKFALKSPYKQDWYKFIYSHFRIKNGKWDEQEEAWIVKKQAVSAESIVNNTNNIYKCLLAGKSITGSLFNTKKRKLNLPFGLIRYYLIEVENMRKEQVQSIERLAIKLIDLASKDDRFNKFITPIEGAKKPWELRITLLRAVKTNFKEQEKEPLLTVNDYVEYLFPDGQYWSETRDLLLICIYEELHKRRMVPKELVDNDIETPDQF